MTLLFIDTEFTSLRVPELISVALVDAHGREFYAERSDFPRAACTPFVVEHVLPLLGAEAERRPYAAIRASLADWLAPYAADRAEIGCDDPRDWALFRELCDDAVPPWIACRFIGAELDGAALAAWFERPDVRRHHALDDARGNRLAYRAPDTAVRRA
jgi:hypothetical protein